MKTDPEITFNLRPKPGRDSLYGLESDTSSSPRKLRKTSSAFSRRIEVPIPHLEDDATATSRSISPGTPPIVSYRTSKRKVGDTPSFFAGVLTLGDGKRVPPDLNMLLVLVHGSTCYMYAIVAYLNSMKIPCTCLAVIEVAMVGFLVVV
ncbi:hypothetical protein GW17_00021456 [Ensete ventricosum]|nr:hypothetical protein GW17_00021456 [Ensete ventricosum]